MLRHLLESAWQADSALVHVGSSGGKGETRLVRLPRMGRGAPGRPGPASRQRATLIDGEPCPSISAAGKALGICPQTLRYRLVRGQGRCTVAGREVQWAEGAAARGTENEEGSAR